MQIAVLKDAYAESELPGALGCSRRAARRLANELGIRLGNRKIIPRSKLLAWLDSQSPQPRTEKPPTLDASSQEFRISEGPR